MVFHSDIHWISGLSTHSEKKASIQVLQGVVLQQDTHWSLYRLEQLLKGIKNTNITVWSSNSVVRCSVEKEQKTEKAKSSSPAIIVKGVNCAKPTSLYYMTMNNYPKRHYLSGNCTTILQVKHLYTSIKNEKDSAETLHNANTHTLSRMFTLL